MFGVYQNSGLKPSEQYWTGKCLQASKNNPDIAFLVVDKKNASRPADERKIIKVTSMWNKSEWTPILSSFTGLTHASVSLVHILNNLFSSVFAKGVRKNHLKEVARGVDHLGRGIVASVPLFGNTFVFVADMFRGWLLKRKLNHQLKTSNNKFEGKITLFGKCGINDQKNFSASLKTLVLDLAPRYNGFSTTQKAIQTAPSA